MLLHVLERTARVSPSYCAALIFCNERYVGRSSSTTRLDHQFTARQKCCLREFFLEIFYSSQKLHQSLLLKFVVPSFCFRLQTLQRRTVILCLQNSWRRRFVGQEMKRCCGWATCAHSRRTWPALSFGPFLLPFRVWTNRKKACQHETNRIATKHLLCTSKHSFRFLFQ